MNHERKPFVRYRWAAIAIGAIVVVLVFLVVVRGVTHRGLAALGFSDSQGGSVSLGLHHIRIAGIAIGSKSNATITVTYSLNSLIHGRVDTIDVTDTALHGVIGLNGSIALDGFTPPPPNARPAKALVLPAERVKIDGLSFELETPVGPSTLTGDGILIASDDGFHLTSKVDLTKGDATGTSPVDFIMSSAGWSLALTPVHFAFGGTNAIEGYASFKKLPEAGITGEARLDGANLTVGTIPVSRLTLNFLTGPDGQSGGLILAPADGSAGIEAALKNDATGLTATVKAAFAEIGPIAKAFGGIAIAGPLKAKLALNAGAATGPRPVTLNLDYDGPIPGGIVLSRATLTETGSFDAAGDAVTLDSCGKFSAEGVAIAALTLDRLSGCLGPADGAPLYRRDPSGSISMAGSFGKIAATVPSSTGTLAEVTLPSLFMRADIAERRVGSFSVESGDGGIGLPDLGAGIRDLKVKAAGAIDGSVSGTLTAGFSAMAAKSPMLPIAGTLTGNLRDKMNLALTAGSADHLPIIKATVNNDGAKLDMAETALGEDGADLIGLMPGLAASASKLSGTLALSATADWSGRSLVSRGSITLKGFGATTPAFTVEGLDTAVTLINLQPLTTAENQILTMKRLRTGVPLTDGRITFELDKRHVLNIADARWGIAGGTVGTFDQHLDLYGPDQNLGVVVKDVDLGELLKLVDVGGLSAEGTLEGAIPLRRIKDIIRVEHGFLQTRAVGGVIRYDPTDTPSFLQGQQGEATAILRDALKDFHYEQVSITIDGILGGEEKIKMSLKGANPAVYGGSAIALNLNLSGALDSIARSSIEAYTRPAETIRRKLQKKSGDKK
jgi:hypothetical protein